VYAIVSEDTLFEVVWVMLFEIIEKLFSEVEQLRVGFFCDLPADGRVLIELFIQLV